MKRSRFSEEQIIYAPPASREWYPGWRPLLAARGQRNHFLHLEKEVGVSGRERTPPTAAGGRGEQPVETARGRSLARQAHAVGGPAKKSLRPARRRELAHWFRDTFSVSCARACHLAQFSRAALHRKSRDKGRTALRLRMRDLAHATPQFGYRRIWVWLRREGWVIKRKQVRRLHRLDGLHLFMRVRRRKHIALHRGPAPIPTGPMERWSMDFVHDTLADGRPILILTIVDHWSRSSPVVEMGGRMSGERIGWIPGRMTANWTLRR